MVRKLLVFLILGFLILGTVAPVLATKGREREAEPEPEITCRRNDDCEYRLNAELEKEVNTFLEGLANKHDLQLLSIESDVFGRVCRINWRRNE